MKKHLFFTAWFVLGLSAETEQPAIEAPQLDATKTDAVANIVKKPIKEEKPQPRTIPVMQKPDNSDIENAGLVEFKSNWPDNTSPHDHIIEKVDRDHLVETRIMMGNFISKNP